MSKQAECSNRKAERKLIRLLMIAVFKWLTWCLVHRPYDFSATLDDVQKAARKIMSHEGDLYSLFIEALEGSRDRARESKTSISEGDT